jgi:hypothetical protein
MLGLLAIHQVEFTNTYYSLNLTVITLRSFFTGWPVAFFCRCYPNSLSLSLRVSAATKIHRYCIHFLSSFILADYSVVTTVVIGVELALYSWYNHGTDHRKHLPLHCWHLCAEPFHSNGRYASNVALQSRCLAILCIYVTIFSSIHHMR